MTGRERFVRAMATLLAFGILGGVGAASAGETDPVKPLLDAAGLASVQPTYLHVTVSEEETAPGGKTTQRSTTLWYRFPQLDPVRLELGHGVVLVRKGTEAWAVIKGKRDKRPQAAMMARGTQNEKLFPLALPFSLLLRGVHVAADGQTTFEGKAVDRLRVTFEHGFYGTPVMNTAWSVLVDPGTHKIVAASFVPSLEMRAIAGEGVRYRFLRWTEVAGATLPETVVIEGFDPGSGVATGHVNVIKLTYSTDANPPVTLFIDPDELKRLEEE